MESPNNQNMFTIAEAVKNNPEAKNQSGVKDAVKALKMHKQGKPMPEAKVPVVSTEAHDRAEKIGVITPPEISSKPATPPPAAALQPPVETPPPKPTDVTPPPATAPTRVAATPPTEPPTPTPTPEPLSKGWAEITKKEALLRREKDALRAERQAIDQAKAAQATALEAKIKADPFGALADAGWTMEALLERSKQGVNLPSVAAPAQKPVAPPPAPAPALTQEQIRETVQAELAVKEYYTNCLKELDKPEFKLLKSLPNSGNEIIKFVNLVAKQHGQVLHPTQAATILQKDYQESLRKQVTNSAVQEALGIQFGQPPQNQPAATPPAAAPEAAKKQVSKVVTNSLGFAPTLPGVPPKKTEMQTIAEAANFLRQQRVR